MPKGEVESFDTYSPEMLEYCKQDVEITHAVYNTLKKESNGFSKSCITLEHQVRRIIDQQERNGFALDMKKAMLLLGQLSD